VATSGASTPLELPYCEKQVSEQFSLRKERASAAAGPPTRF
jgi:hypothetical protein